MGTNSICSCNNKEENNDFNIFKQDLNKENQPIENNSEPGIKDIKDNKHNYNIENISNISKSTNLCFTPDSNNQNVFKSKDKKKNSLSSYSLNSTIDFYSQKVNLQKISYIQSSIRKFLLSKHKLNNNHNKKSFVYNGKDDVINRNTIKSKLSHKHKEIRYFGTKKNDKKEGFGIQVWLDGAMFIGKFRNDTAESFGRYIHKENDVYEGEFTQNVASGYGIYLHSNGNSYEGQWLNDTQNGYGIEIWKDKSMFKGQYIQGKKDGFGEYTWADGSSYMGEWRENLLNGYGIYKFSDKRLFKGEWKNNNMDGYGEFFWNDGKRFKGNYINDKKEDFGIFYWEEPTIKVYIGYWRDGKQNGIGKYISNKYIRWGLWIDGVRSKWYKSREDCLNENEVNVTRYEKFFIMNLTEAVKYMLDD